MTIKQGFPSCDVPGLMLKTKLFKHLYYKSGTWLPKCHLSTYINVLLLLNVNPCFMSVCKNTNLIKS